jgi:hypothetical protein
MTEKLEGKMKEKEKLSRSDRKFAIQLLAVAFVVFSSFYIIMSLDWTSAQPDGPSEVIIVSNETKTTNPAFMVNISGGYISTINITAVMQNPRWKAFVGNVTGKFTLDDASGSAIFDWTLATISGQIYAARNDSSLNWGVIACASTANIEDENIAMGHTNVQDNITTTFSSGTHPGFFVGSQPILQDDCDHALNTFVSSSAQSSNFFEVALNTEGNIVYATVIEDSETGFDGAAYDFQMIVPEIGTPGFGGATAYYIYVELT